MAMLMDHSVYRNQYCDELGVLDHDRVKISVQLISGCAQSLHRDDRHAACVHFSVAYRDVSN